MKDEQKRFLSWFESNRSLAEKSRMNYAGAINSMLGWCGLEWSNVNTQAGYCQESCALFPKPLYRPSAWSPVQQRYVQIAP